MTSDGGIQPRGSQSEPKRVPLQAPGRQSARLSTELGEAWRRVLASGRFLSGDEVLAFEGEFASYCDRQYCVAVANGTDALEIALRALGCNADQEMITVANAGMYSTTACLRLGAVPVFADVCPDDLLMAPDSVGALVGPQTAAVIVTHLYGKLADVDAIRAAIEAEKIPILEDCAQGHGARTGAGVAGAFGEIAAFSFYPTKNLGALGDAGAIVTDRADLAGRCRQLREYGWSKRFVAQLSGGGNSRMDELQAAMLRVKLPRLDGWNAERRRISERYRQAMAGSDWRLVQEGNEDWVAHLCVARHPCREVARQHLDAAGIDTAVHYPVPDHRQEALSGVPWRAGSLEVTEHAVNEIVTLPCFPELSGGEIDRVCEALETTP